MNKHELMLTMPTTTVKFETIDEVLEKESDSLMMAKRFVKSLSLSHYLKENLLDLDFEQVVNLFEYLHQLGFSIELNNFSFYSEDQSVMDLASNFDYGIGYKFISNLVKYQTDITDKVILIDDEEMTIAQVYAMDLIISRNDMQIGDMPTVMTMLTAQKALFALFCTVENIERLSEAKGDVEIFQTLPTLL